MNTDTITGYVNLTPNVLFPNETYRGILSDETLFNFDLVEYAKLQMKCQEDNYYPISLPLPLGEEFSKRFLKFNAGELVTRIPAIRPNKFIAFQLGDRPLSPMLIRPDNTRASIHLTPRFPSGTRKRSISLHKICAELKTLIPICHLICLSAWFRI